LDPGTIRWTGSDFEGWNGVIWVSLTGGIQAGSMLDQDGNKYRTITIGNQEWMVDNLKTSKYNDGANIGETTDDDEWSNLGKGAWCWYANDSKNENIYAKLYNWLAIATDKLCPTDWRVPTDADWMELTDFLINNGYGYEGSGYDISKALAAKSGWAKPSDLGTPGNDLTSNNKSGFTGLPGGIRRSDGTFDSDTFSAFFWSSTGSLDDAWFRLIGFNNEEVLRNKFDKLTGMSVRCIRK
jgi:uncharacterized protein (TIGR02145 family)